jgi:hypothetical protein
MRDRKDRGDRGRMSWREIDQLRDKSRSRDRDPMAKASSPTAIVAQKSYRAALEKAFEAGKLEELAKTLSRVDEPKPPAPPPAAAREKEAPSASPQAAAGAPPPAAPAAKDPDRENRQKMLVRIKEAEGREPISRAIDAFLGRYPKLPDDFEVLTKALAHRDDDRVRETLDRLEHLLLHNEKPRRARTLAAQVRLLEDTHSDPEIRRRAAEVRSRL